MATVNSFWAPIKEKIDAGHKREADMHDQQRDAWLAIAQSPDSSDDVRNWAIDQYSKSLHPETRKAFGQIQPIMGKLFGMGAKKQQGNAPMSEKIPGTNATSAGPIPAPSGPTQLPTISQVDSSRNLPPGPIFDRKAAWAREDERAIGKEKELAKIRTDEAIRLAQAKPASRGAPKQLKATLPDGSSVDIWRFNDGTITDLRGGEMELPEGATLAEKAAAMQKVYYRPKGSAPDSPWKLAYYDPKHPEKRVDAGSGESVSGDVDVQTEALMLAAERQKMNGAYNDLRRAEEGRGFSPEEAAQRAGFMIDEDIKRRIETKGASSSRDTVMVQNGEYVKVPLTTTKTLNPLPAMAPPSQAQPAPVQAPPVPVTAPPGGGDAVGALPPAPVAAVPKPIVTPRPQAPIAPRTAPAPSGGARALNAVPPAQYTSMRKDLNAVRTGATQIFGDPNQPDMQALVKFGDVADNPESRTRLGNALRLTFEGFDQSTGGGSAGLSGEGGALNVGGIGTWVGNTMGIPSAVANQQAAMMQDAIKKLTPRERQAYNATIASAEAIISLRKLTGASPSQQSVRAIQEALPIIGVNTVDTEQFNDRMQRLGAEFIGGTRGIPKVAMDPETQNFMQSLGSRVSPKTAPGIPTIDTKAEYDKLPKGAQYIDKQTGKKATKP